MQILSFLRNPQSNIMEQENVRFSFWHWILFYVLHCLATAMKISTEQICSQTLAPYIDQFCHSMYGIHGQRKAICVIIMLWLQRIDTARVSIFWHNSPRGGLGPTSPEKVTSINSNCCLRIILMSQLSIWSGNKQAIAWSEDVAIQQSYWGQWVQLM